MLKTILLTGTMMIAAPALAQTTAPTGQTTPSTATSTMQGSAAPTATTPMQDPATTSAVPTTGTTAPTTGTTAQAGAADAKPTQSQVAQVVDQQFTTYDKDANGALSKAEFAAWMTALKSQSPAAQAGSPAEETAWNDAAFTQADGDKSTTVTKTELTAFLVRGAASSS